MNPLIIVYRQFRGEVVYSAEDLTIILKSESHSKFDLKHHIVWCPKYRRLALKGNIGKFVTHVIQEIAKRYDFEIAELAVMSDHVHMFVSATPEISPAKIFQVFKSITARAMFKRFPSNKRLLWGGALWSESIML